MRLTDLSPKFLKRLDDKSWRHDIEKVEDADGLEFLCPACFRKNGGIVGTHAVICWSPSVPQTTFPTPGRWTMVGTGFHDLSLVAGSSSVLIKNPDGSEHWHGLVTNGEVTG